MWVSQMAVCKAADSDRTVFCPANSLPAKLSDGEAAVCVPPHAPHTQDTPSVTGRSLAYTIAY